MTWDDLCALGLATELSTSFGTPALKVKGKMFCRLKENGEDVVFFLNNVDEQLFLIETQPELYFITPHYEGWPAVLARLKKLRKAEAAIRLELGWRLKAPKSVLKAREAGVTGPYPPSRPTRTRRARARD
jgi:hypothetical protein